MTLLVTGASGFVGAALAAALASRGHPVRAAARGPLPATLAGRVTPVTLPDLAGRDLDAAFAAILDGVTAIVHPAGLAHQPAGTDEARMMAVNAHAAGSFARAAAARGIDRFVLISSARAISGPAAAAALSEATPPAPTDAYGRSKLAGETAVRNALPSAVVLRPPVLHGAGAQGNMARLARLARWPAPLPVGGFAGRRSILSDANLAEAVAFVLAAPDAAGGLFHVTDGPPLTLGEMIGLMRQGIGHSRNVFALPAGWSERLVSTLTPSLAAQLCRDLVLDDTALRALGWRPAEPSSAGLGRMARG